jgi:Tfp pilus assembly protein FimT
MVVLVLSGVTLSFASLSLSGYLHRTSAQRAAQVFAQDLSLARSAALRGREAVVIRFFETSRWYTVSLQGTGTELTRRRFGLNADIDLSGVDLLMGGDSVVFSRRGMADLSTTTGSLGLGEARFVSGVTSYTVYFNAMGASRVEES